MSSGILPKLMQQRSLLISYCYSIIVTVLTITQQQRGIAVAKAIDLLDASQLSEYTPNYCNNSELVESAGLIRSTLGQFLGFECSAEFFHCRWQSDGFRTYKKLCRPGLVYDTLGTQNCNYDYNVKGCTMRTFSEDACTSEQFLCPLSEVCVNMSQRCDGRYDCALEEDEQNCPICETNYFPCVASEQCIPMKRRCDGFPDCSDGTDEMNCEACPAGWFYCQKSKQCIEGPERCDGVEQCHTGEDEALCKFPKEQEFVCEDRNHKIPLAQLCDGIEQCPDRSDELYCYRNIDLSPMTFSQHNKPRIITHQPVKTPEATNNDNDNIKKRLLEKTEEVIEYQAESTTTQMPLPMRKTTRPLFGKVSSGQSVHRSRTPLLRSSRRPTTTTTESSVYSQESTTVEEGTMQIEGNYEDELALVTVPNQVQHGVEEAASSNLLFPQNLSSSSGAQKTTPKDAKNVSTRKNAVPKVEVAHSADHFPFLQISSALQKASNISRASQLIDLTSNQPDENDLPQSRHLTTRKQKKLTVKEITVPFHQRVQTTTVSSATGKQAQLKSTKFTKTTATSSRRSFMPSRNSQIPKQSTTKTPMPTTFETPEAEILQRIGSHFRTDKNGRTLSPKDLLEKIEMLLNKDDSYTQRQNIRDEDSSTVVETSLEAQYPPNVQSSYHRNSNSAVTQRPTTKWRPSLSSGPVRTFTSRIKRPTTRIPMMNYADVQMRHSDAPNEKALIDIHEQNPPLFPQLNAQNVAVTSRPKSPVTTRLSRSTTNSSYFQRTALTPMPKVYDVSTFLIDALKNTTVAVTSPTTAIPEYVERYHKVATLENRQQFSYATRTSSTPRTTASVLLSNILDGDDQSSRL